MMPDRDTDRTVPANERNQIERPFELGSDRQNGDLTVSPFLQSLEFLGIRAPHLFGRVCSTGAVSRREIRSFQMNPEQVVLERRLLHGSRQHGKISAVDLQFRSNDGRAEGNRARLYQGFRDAVNVIRGQRRGRKIHSQEPIDLKVGESFAKHFLRVYPPVEKVSRVKQRIHFPGLLAQQVPPNFNILAIENDLQHAGCYARMVPLFERRAWIEAQGLGQKLRAETPDRVDVAVTIDRR
jgi:hypothetical protein